MMRVLNPYATADDLGPEEADVGKVVASVLAKLPGDHEIRAST